MSASLGLSGWYGGMAEMSLFEIVDIIYFCQDFGIWIFPHLWQLLATHECPLDPKCFTQNWPSDSDEHLGCFRSFCWHYNHREIDLVPKKQAFKQISRAQHFFWKDAHKMIIHVPKHFLNGSMSELMTRAFRNTPVFWSDSFNSRSNLQLNFENRISGYEILAKNYLFSRLFRILNTFMIFVDPKCYTWLESPWAVEYGGTFGFEFTLGKIYEIILSGCRFDTVSHIWHLLISTPAHLIILTTCWEHLIFPTSWR